MKFRTVNYFAKEGFSNVWTNKKMSLASSFVVLVLLLAFGSLFLAAINIGSITAKILSTQSMEAFIVDSADGKTASLVAERIRKVQGVQSAVVVSKEQGFKELKDTFADHKDLLSGLNPNTFLPYKVVIKVKRPEDANRIKTYVASIKEVKKVNYAQKVMDKALKLTKTMKIVAYVAVALLGIIALFIIIYTIKLTVFARRREITIMKYVGATDWFVKWPFIIEGVIIGLIGAVFAILLIILGYNYVFDAFENISVDALKLIPMDMSMKKQLFVMFVIWGSGVGAVGSTISVRKYLYV